MPSSKPPHNQAFQIRLADAGRRVDAALTSALDHNAAGTPSRLMSAMRHATLSGGKRFRPFLALESAAMFGIPPESAVATAAALECVHCYSLVHDDLPAMDNDRLRRGKPTVWAAYDDWTAILTGDALLTLAFEIIASAETHAEPGIRVALSAALAKAAGRAGMVGGQCLDLQAEKLNQPPRQDFNHVKSLQDMKTGALIRFACESGAILGGASAPDRDALRTFGGHLGFAFQIADDLLDVEGDDETVGKATGKDAEAGKATIVEILGIDEARNALKNAHAAAHAALDAFNGEADLLRAAADFAVRRSF